MKTLLLIIVVLASLSFNACNDAGTSKENATTNNDTSSQAISTNNSVEQKNTRTINDIVSSYLSLKNALTDDNSGEAASAAKNISATLAKVDESALTPDQKRVYDDVKDEINEHAEHIAGSKIDHQREHFDLLSQDMIDLVKAVGTSQTLYRDFCPMYNNKKGAYWLSETKEIKNPYYGKEMIKCGEVKEEIKAKG